MAFDNRAAARRFTADVTRFEHRVRGRLDDFVRRIALVMAENVIVGGEFAPGTPIDTGFARASWYLVLNAETAQRVNTAIGSNPRGSLDDIALDIVRVRAGDLLIFANGAAYIRRLEFDGWSGQAPVGFVRITAAAGQNIVDRVARDMGAL